MSTPSEGLGSSSMRRGYGSIDGGSASSSHHDHEALIGENLVATDNEEEPSSNGTGTSVWKRLCCDSLLNLRGNHPIGHVTRVVMILGVALCMGGVAWVLSPMGASSLDPPGSSSSSGERISIPFPKVDRASYSQPASDIVNPDLFHPDLLHSSTKRRLKEGDNTESAHPFLVVPFPTGAFWTNLVIKPTADRGLSYPVVAYPYAFKWSDTLLQASYPPLRRRMDSISIRDTFVPDMQFSTTEELTNRYVTNFDPLSVTIRFQTKSDGGYWETYLVQGSPYITIKYKKATPVLRALSIFKNVVCPRDEDGNYNDGTSTASNNHSTEELRGLKWGVCTSSDSSKVDGGPVQSKTLHGVQFLLQTQEGLTWMVFASEPIALKFDAIRKTTVTATENYSGVLRLALIPPPVATDGASDAGSAPFSKSTGVKRLIYHASVYPVGGSVSWDFQSASKGIFGGSGNGPLPPNRLATIHFQFNTMSLIHNSETSSTSGQEELLMLSLPHHVELFRSDVLLLLDQFDLVYRTIKGSMVPVVGDSWSYQQLLPSLGFDDVHVAGNKKYAQEMDQDVRRIIMDNVKKDMVRVLPTFDENVYGFGKQVARLAQLAHISNLYAPIDKSGSMQNQTDTMQATTIKLAQMLHSYLARFLTGGVTDPLLYDANFGGMVSTAGLLNSEADFGNGWYNDHHFHYGYTLYACAIMGELNETFVSTYFPYVDALLFDIAHSSSPDSQALTSDAFFPLARHKSWFDGHSFASGLFPFGNGKSQESSSEAVNGYYGAYLWSLVRYGTDSEDGLERTDFARLLLATELRGAKMYWHMQPPEKHSDHRLVPEVYNPTFAKNYMVGNLGMLDAVCSTWFGTASLYVHMINFMPVTAVTALLFNKTYVGDEFKNVLEPLLSGVEMAWKGFVICDQAILDPSAAWIEAQDLVSYELDSSLSKSQVLHWISTHGGAKFTIPASSSTPSPEPGGGSNKSNTNGSSKCESNKGCASLGLTGECCPTLKGTSLSCCNS